MAYIGILLREIENFFASNPRLGLMVRSLDKMKPDRKNLIYTAANQFIEKNTYV